MFSDSYGKTEIDWSSDKNSGLKNIEIDIYEQTDIHLLI